MMAAKGIMGVRSTGKSLLYYSDQLQTELGQLMAWQFRQPSPTWLTAGTESGPSDLESVRGACVCMLEIPNGRRNGGLQHDHALRVYFLTSLSLQ